MKRISTYAEAGVDRTKEETAVYGIMGIIKQKSSFKGKFGDFFANGIEFGDYFLSLATDGVGSKVILAETLEKFDTIGIDCVAMNVNDLITIGSVPKGFVDYIAIREPDESKIKAIVSGVIEGCNISEIPLLGGETATMPELFADGKNYFDLSGTAFGIQDKTKIIDGSAIRHGDVIIGIQSSGIHSNGLTLARKLFEETEKNWLHELLTPTRIYVKPIMELLSNEIPIKGMAHITGGGFRNVLRMGEYHYSLDSWDVPPIFNEIQERGSVASFEMYSTFNMGIGFVVIVNPAFEETTLEILNRHYPSFRIGTIEKGNKVTIGDLTLLPNRR